MGFFDMFSTEFEVGDFITSNGLFKKKKQKHLDDNNHYIDKKILQCYEEYGIVVDTVIDPSTKKILKYKVYFPEYVYNPDNNARSDPRETLYAGIFELNVGKADESNITDFYLYSSYYDRLYNTKKQKVKTQIDKICSYNTVTYKIHESDGSETEINDKTACQNNSVDSNNTIPSASNNNESTMIDSNNTIPAATNNEPTEINVGGKSRRKQQKKQTKKQQKKQSKKQRNKKQRKQRSTRKQYK